MLSAAAPSPTGNWAPLNACMQRTSPPRDWYLTCKKLIHRRQWATCVEDVCATVVMCVNVSCKGAKRLATMLRSILAGLPAIASSCMSVLITDRATTRRPRRLGGGKGGESHEPKEPKNPNVRAKRGLPQLDRLSAVAGRAPPPR